MNLGRGALLAALLGAASGYRAPVCGLGALRPRQQGFAQRTAVAAASASDADGEEPLIGGLPIAEGDQILCRDDASDAWWRASVRETRGSQVLVHYSGCDDAWDEWMEASSPKLMRMDSAEQQRDKSPFQSDTIEDEIESEALLEEYRQERWDNNARWQLTTFAEAQMGAFAGEIELYEADGDGGVRRVVGPWQPACSSSGEIVSNEEIELVDTLPAPAADLAVSLRMGAPAFRPEKGNMAVAGAFSLATPLEGQPAGGLLLEVSLREEGRRVRCKLRYTPDDEDGADAPATDGEAAPTGTAPRMSVRNVAIVREVLGGGEFVDGDAGDGDIDGTPGRGLYDPPLGDKSGYISLYCEGGVTLVFPTVVAANAPGVISLDWIAGQMRYQVDRKFKVLDGSLASLELTEIQKKDAEVVLPNFPHQNNG